MRFWPSRAGSMARSICGTIDDTAKRTRVQCAAFHLTRDGAKPQDGLPLCYVLE